MADFAERKRERKGALAYYCHLHHIAHYSLHMQHPLPAFKGFLSSFMLSKLNPTNCRAWTHTHSESHTDTHIPLFLLQPYCHMQLDICMKVTPLFFSFLVFFFSLENPNLLCFWLFLLWLPAQLLLKFCLCYVSPYLNRFWCVHVCMCLFLLLYVHVRMSLSLSLSLSLCVCVCVFFASFFPQVMFFFAIFGTMSDF